MAFALVVSSFVVLVVTIGGTIGLASNRASMLGLVALLAFFATPQHLRSPLGFVGMVRASARTLCHDARNLARGALTDRQLRLAWVCVGVPWMLLFVGRAFTPPVAWDALTYHLFFPLHWIQSGHLDTLVQPTGEPSSPYYPLVGEMHFYWGLLSTGSDAWTAVAQTPFLALGSLAVAGIARIQGGNRSASVLAAALWASFPVALRQSVEPMVDIVQPTFFLLAAFFLLRWKSEGGAWRCALAGAALGLTCGVKYTGLVWSASLVPLVIAGFRHSTGNSRRLRDALLMMGPAIALGGYSYIRNLWTGGNPVLPLHLAIAGHTLFPGARSAGAYFGSELHQSALGALVASPRALLDLGFTLPLCLVGAVLSIWLPPRERPEKAAASRGVAIASILSVCLFLLVVPYREPRHLLGPAALAIATIPGLLVRIGRGLHGGTLVGALPVLNAPFAMFYWIKDALRLGPDMRYAMAALAAVAFSILMWRVIPSVFASPVHRPPADTVRFPWRWAAVGAVLVWTVVGGALSGYESGRFERWQRYWSTRIEWGASEARPDFAEGARAWTILAKETRGAPSVVAYSGSNIPYPLAGYGLKNRVLFVPRNAAAASWHYDWTTPLPDPFRNPSADAWRTNVANAGARYLCVFREFKGNDPGERFPIEAEWANANPSEFRLVWSARWARLYEVHL